MDLSFLNVNQASHIARVFASFGLFHPRTTPEEQHHYFVLPIAEMIGFLDDPGMPKEAKFGNARSAAFWIARELRDIMQVNDQSRLLLAAYLHQCRHYNTTGMRAAWSTDTFGYSGLDSGIIRDKAERDIANCQWQDARRLPPPLPIQPQLGYAPPADPYLPEPRYETSSRVYDQEPQQTNQPRRYSPEPEILPPPPRRLR